MHRTPSIFSVQISKWLFIFICGLHNLYAQQSDTIAAQKAWVSGQRLMAQEQWTDATNAFQVADSLFAQVAPTRSRMARLASSAWRFSNESILIATLSGKLVIGLILYISKKK